MSNTDLTPKTPRARAARATARTAAEGTTASKTRRRQAKATDAPSMLSSERRRSLIAEHAYLRAERRGFVGGDPVADWLESEKEVDTLLSRSAE